MQGVGSPMGLHTFALIFRQSLCQYYQDNQMFRPISYHNTILGNYCHSTKLTNGTVGAVVTPTVKHENKGGTRCTRSRKTNVAPSGGVIYLSVPR